MTPGVVVFLRSGTLGALRLGASSSDVERELGLAFSRSRSDTRTEIWKYGPLQVTVVNGKVSRLTLSCLDQSPLPAVLRDVTVPSPKTTVYSIIDMLDEHDISWQIDQTY